MAESMASDPAHRGILKMRSGIQRTPKKTSQASLMEDFMKAYLPVENTYKMAPERPFDAREIQQRAEYILREQLEGTEYKPENCRDIALKVAEGVKEEAKLSNMERYKIVCLVFIGSMEGQGLNVASRCLLDERFDKWCTAEYRSSFLFGVAIVYGILVE